MLTMVTSRPTIRRLMEQMRRIPMRRLRLSSLIAPGAAAVTCRFITMLTLQGDGVGAIRPGKKFRKLLDLHTV